MRIKSGIIRLLLLFALFAIAFTACGFEGDVELLGTAPVQVGGTGVTTLSQKLAWLKDNAEDGGTYIIKVEGTERIDKSILYYEGKKIIIRITGNNGVVSGTGTIFEVGSGVTLVLDNIRIAMGWGQAIGTPPDVPLVIVSLDGVLVMNEGTEILGNEADDIAIEYGDYGGGGVLVDGGTFIMNGGSIHNNSAVNGGGVYVTNGAFTMNGGSIYSNKAIHPDPANPVDPYDDRGQGGGVYVSDRGTFTMNGGGIYGNDAGNGGGGVLINTAYFYKNGGIIYGRDTTGAGYENKVYRNYNYIDDYGHAIFALYSVSTFSIGTRAIGFDFRFIDETIGKDEALSSGLHLSGVTWNGPWIIPEW